MFLKSAAKVAMYLLGIICFLLVVLKEEFYDGTRLRFWDMTATLEKWPNCYDKWGLKTFEFSERNIESQGECSRFNYGIFTMPLYRFMAFVSQNEVLWSYSLFLTISLIVVAITPKLWKVHLIILAVLISPPTTLLFESGNPDLLNILLCFLAGIALFKNRLTFFTLSSAIVALHKYYGAALWLILVIRIHKEKILGKILILLLIVSTSLTLMYQIFFMGLYKFSDAGSNHYGITIWDNYLRKSGINISELVVHIVGLASLVVISTFIYRKYPNEFQESLPLRLSGNTSLVFYIVFIFSYVTTSNVDYRLTFLGIAIITDASHYLGKSLLSRWVLFMALVSLYMSYPMGYRELISGVPLQAIGDLILHLVVSYCSARSWALMSRSRKDFSSTQINIG